MSADNSRYLEEIKRLVRVAEEAHDEGVDLRAEVKRLEEQTQRLTSVATQAVSERDHVREDTLRENSELQREISSQAERIAELREERRYDGAAIDGLVDQLESYRAMRQEMEDERQAMQDELDARPAAAVTTQEEREMRLMRMSALGVAAKLRAAYPDELRGLSVIRIANDKLLPYVLTGEV